MTGRGFGVRPRSVIMNKARMTLTEALSEGGQDLIRKRLMQPESLFLEAPWGNQPYTIRMQNPPMRLSWQSAFHCKRVM